MVRDARRDIGLVAVMILMLTMLHPFPIAADALEFRQTGIQAGEFWRLVTGHIVHVSLQHLVLNCVALALLLFIFGCYFTSGELAVFAAAGALFISLSLLLWHPEIEWYRGASGIAHGFCAIGAIRMIERSGHILAGSVALVLLFTKVVIESYDGMTFAHIGSNVIVEAHAYGFAFAVLWRLVEGLWRSVSVN